nr:AAA domain-containing protein [Nocardia bovistercoris]
MILSNPDVIAAGPEFRIEVDGRLVEDATSACYFNGWGQGSWHVFYGTAGRFSVRAPDQVRIVRDGGFDDGPAAILAYWKAIAVRLPEGGRTLRDMHGKGLPVHPDSALARYLDAAPIEPVERPDSPPLYPFHTNLSQRAAIDCALRHTISVIDGPPGTGKTQTILNLIANIIVDESKTVAVVSSNNAAVDNVHTKLVKAGFGYVTANLGNREKRITFLGTQDSRNQVVEQLRGSPARAVRRAEEMAALDGRLLGLRERERELAELRTELAAYRLEYSHFSGYLERHELPDQERLPVLRWRSAKILAFIIATDPDLARTSGIAGTIQRIGNFFRYRSMRFADARDIDVILRLQQLYYEKKMAELEQRIDSIQKSLEHREFDRLAEEQREQSEEWLIEQLRRRYEHSPTRRYDSRYQRNWHTFSRDYPVILSTCHSLQNSIGAGRLVDYLIVDEASQADLLSAAAVLACGRNVIVVGDLRQLKPTIDEEKPYPLAPNAAYDYREHSLLSSLTALYGDRLPRVMLREHYRCDPAIIGFCNQKFYDDRLVPFTRVTDGYPAMILARTAEGNHMRRVRGSDKVERINQREIDVIEREVLPRFCTEFSADQIGVTTPYRKQANRVTDALIASIESDTVHSFQGREKEAIVMTTVLDETRSGRRGLEFADRPELVNVAVSRAMKRFVLVTNYDMLPTSRNLRDLIGYIRYQNPNKEIFDSSVVSVFDLFYRDYSARLLPIASRIREESPHQTENIMRAVLEEVLEDDRFQGIRFAEQVILKNLLPDTERLTTEQRRFVGHRSASVDFDVFNSVTKERVCVIEVDGFSYHEARPEQLRRDAIKDAICAAYGIPVLRFPTTGSAEIERLRRELAILTTARAGTSAER